MTKVRITLSPEELQQLNNGESIKTGDGVDDVKVHPPCEEYGHDWSRYSVRHSRDSSDVLERRCNKCDATEVADTELDNIFEEEGTIEDDRS